MRTEAEFYITAVEMIRQHGQSANIQAAIRVDLMRAVGEREGLAV